MKFEVDFTQEEYEALAQIAKRFGRTSKTRLKSDHVELLLAEYEYDFARAAMEKIARKCSDDGLYADIISRHTTNLADFIHKKPEEPS